MKKQINLPDKFLQEISNFKKIYIEVSGGYNSNVSVLLFYEIGFKDITLIHNHTYLQYKECLENITKLIDLTNYSIIIKYPKIPANFKSINEVIKVSFQNIDKAKQNIKQYRDFFPCCRILKMKHNKSWNNKMLLNNSIIISSLTPYESFNRQMRLFELKKQNTYIRFHKTQNIFKGYPYRDLLVGNRRYSRNIFDKLFENKLKEYNLNIKHSGCRIYPIRILFPDMLIQNDCSIKYNNFINLFPNKIKLLNKKIIRKIGD